VEQLLLPDGSPIWMITRYEDALAALNNRKLSKNFDNALPEAVAHAGLRRRKSILKPAHEPCRPARAHPAAQTGVQGVHPAAGWPTSASGSSQITDGLLDAIAEAGTADLKDSFISR